MTSAAVVSRCVYPVRSLAGLSRDCDVLRRDCADKIADAYKLYCQRSKNSALGADKSATFRRNHALADTIEGM